MKLSRLLLAFLAATWLFLGNGYPLAPAPQAAAQASCPYIVNGAILTAAQWQGCFTAKLDSSTPLIVGPGSVTANHGACWSSPLVLTDCGLPPYSITAGAGITAALSGTAYTVSNTGVLSLSGGTTGLTPSSATTGAVVLGGTLAVANGGTGATSSTGSGAVVLATSPTLVTPALGVPSALTLTNATGLPLTTGVTGTLAVTNGGTGATTSTGSGAVVLATSPTLVTPALGVASATSVSYPNGTKITDTANGILSVANSGATHVDVLSVPVSNEWRLGGADAVGPSAQTISTQNVLTGTLNVQGANLNVSAGQGTGSATGGILNFNVSPAGSSGTAQNALVAALQIDSTKTATFNGPIVGTGGNVTLGTNYSYLFSSRGGLTSIGDGSFQWTNSAGSSSTKFLIPANNELRLGTFDAASPVAQTLSVQNVVTGTTNTAGANWTFNGSKGTGTGAGGSLVFQVAPAGTTGTAQNALATALTIDSTKTATFAGPITGASLALGGATIGANGLAVSGTSSLGGTVTFGGNLNATTGANIGWNGDVLLTRDAANTLALRNGVNAQAFNLYNTYTDASNYERASMYHDGSGFRIDFANLGTGAARALYFGINGSRLFGVNGSLANWNISGGNLITGTDNAYDIGASGASRPRNVYVAGGIQAPTLTATTAFVFGNAGSASVRATASGAYQWGGSDSATPAAQFDGVNNVIAGTTNTAGANRTFAGSQGTGTGVGGSLIFQVAPAGTTGSAQNPLATALTIDSTKVATFAGNVVSSAQLVASTGIQNGGSSQTGWGGRSQMTSPADGNIQLANNAATSFGLLQFGGTTSGFPALKRNGTQLQVRLADDTSFANLYTANSTVDTAGSFIFNSRSLVSSPADGNVLLQNNALTSFGLLQFGGTTSSFPAFKRNGVTIEARLADDSAKTALNSAAVTVDSYVRTTPVPVASLTSCVSGLDGIRQFVTDATVTTFASAVVGGGSNHVPVYCDGSGTPTWKIG